jgi:hypothetical protein
VLNIGKLAGVDYYPSQVASAVEDYYLDDGEPPASGPAPPPAILVSTAGSTSTRCEGSSVATTQQAGR